MDYHIPEVNENEDIWEKEGKKKCFGYLRFTI